MRRVLALLLLATTAVGCMPSARSATPSPVAATPSIAPSGSFLTMAEAGKAYFAAADPYNDAVDRAEAKYGTPSTLEQHQGYWAAIAKADKAFIAGLKKIAFPPEVQGDAAILIKAEEAFQLRAAATSRARSLPEVISLSAVANAAAEVAAAKAAILREGLGLEPTS